MGWKWGKESQYYLGVGPFRHNGELVFARRNCLFGPTQWKLEGHVLFRFVPFCSYNKKSSTNKSITNKAQESQWYLNALNIHCQHHHHHHLHHHHHHHRHRHRRRHRHRHRHHRRRHFLTLIRTCWRSPVSIVIIVTCTIPIIIVAVSGCKVQRGALFILPLAHTSFPMLTF